MKMKRIVGALSIAALTTLSLTSCILPNKDVAVNRDLTYTYTEEQHDTLKKDMENFESYLSGSNQIDLYGAWNEINRQVEAIATCRSIEYLNYCKTGSDDAYDKYLYFQDIITDVVKWMESMYKPIYDSKYKDEFYRDKTEEEIQELINSAKPEEFYDLESESEELIKEYDDLKDYDQLAKAPELYEKLVTIYSKQAMLAGYDGFMSYAYKDIYSREYTPEEVVGFTSYVKEYIIPLTTEYYHKYYDDFSELSIEDQNTVSSFNTAYFETNKTLLDSYAAFLGGEYETTYNHLWAEENGGYIFVPTRSEEEDAMEGAFTTYLFSLSEPVMYFGPGYQDAQTFIHEFGHYNAYYVNRDKDSAQSYDLAETQSQGNEMLFLSYIAENDIFSDDITNVLIDYTVFDALVTILYATMINEFEYKVYQDSTLKAEDYDKVFSTVLDEFGGEEYYTKMNLEPTTYWKRVCLDNPGYYISYAISKVPSLEILALAKDDLEEAKSIYQKVFKNSTYDQDEFLLTIEDAGLKSPFTKEAYEIINTIK